MVIPSLIAKALSRPPAEGCLPAFASFRWTLLRALRAARHGELLKIGEILMHGGTPAVPVIADFMVERGFVLPMPSAWAKNITQLVLSDHGRTILAAGESWWRSLSLPQRLFVALTE